jgi:hypothetical protein
LTIDDSRLTIERTTHAFQNSEFRIQNSLRRSLFLLLILAACDDTPIPTAAPSVDRMARTYLRTLASGNLDSIRLPLSPEGKDLVTSFSLARTLACFEAGPPVDVTLLDAEVADSHYPTPAERHRLTYRLLFGNERSYYYFFELTIEAGDSAITGFRIESRDESADSSRPEGP